MNDAPQEVPDRPTDQTDEPSAAELVRPAGDQVQPLAAADSAAVRTGSPFAVDPVPQRPQRPIETIIDGGPLRYTATGAVVAALMVMAFAVVAAWWFPGGGTMIAALGCVLSIFGLYSSYRITASATLVIHLGLFVLCYGRSIS